MEEVVRQDSRPAALSAPHPPHLPRRLRPPHLLQALRALQLAKHTLQASALLSALTQYMIIGSGVRQWAWSHAKLRGDSRFAVLALLVYQTHQARSTWEVVHQDSRPAALEQILLLLLRLPTGFPRTFPLGNASTATREMHSRASCWAVTQPA